MTASLPAFTRAAGAALLLCITLAVPASGQEKPARDAAAFGKAGGLWFYVGTYTGPKSKGIYLVRLDPATGALSEPQLAGEVTNPSFLTLDPTHQFLYAAGEVDDFGGKKGGAVSAFAISPGSGMLTLLNQQPSGGGGPCYVTVDPGGKNALVANYGGGSIEVLPIGADGRLAEPSTFIQHQGKGDDPKRQEGPHAHCIELDPAGRFVLACDLGLNKVLVYRFDPAKGSLAPNDPPAATLAPGAGPRHLAFSAGGKFAYVINEMASTITAFTYAAGKGALGEIQTVSTLPPDFKGNNTTAELAVHPSGKFVYGSNRGHDSIAVFAVDPPSGKLTARGHEPTQGKSPRNFAIDPTGTWLVAANQGSDSLVVFRIDPATGALKPTGAKAAVPSPVCVTFMPVVK